ncbi:MAG: ATP-binding protein [Bacteroidota bacterium]|nr:ATP-binding protein [Bacteroidota bacterium]
MTKKQLKEKKEVAKNLILDSVNQKTNSQLQEDYAKHLNNLHRKGLPLVATQQFLGSIRDSGYKSTGSAINEMVDNSIESGADQIFIYYYTRPQSNEITDIFVIDSGTGMSKDVLKTAVMWGGTHRHLKKGNFLGKYGFGLPSSALFLSEEYEVYSKNSKTDWYSISINKKELEKEDGNLVHKETGMVMVPEPEKKDIPKKVQEYLYEKQKISTLTSGTIVHVKFPKKYGGLTWGYSTPQNFHSSIIDNLSETYRSAIFKKITIKVNNVIIAPKDPLFLEPEAFLHHKRGLNDKFTEEYDKKLIKHDGTKEGFPFEPTTEGRKKLFDMGIIAKRYESSKFQIKNSQGEWGNITIRFAFYHPKFVRLWDPKNKNLSAMPGDQSDDFDADGMPMKGRWTTLKKYQYAIITRKNRQIDEVTRTSFENKKNNMVLQNQSRYWRMEIDFDPILDEYFGLTVNKQQITLNKKIWDLLSDKGIPQFLRQLDNKSRDLLREQTLEKVIKKREKESSKAEQVTKKHSKHWSPETWSEDVLLIGVENAKKEVASILEKKKIDLDDLEEDNLSPKTKELIAEAVNELERDIKKRPFITALESRGTTAPIFDAELIAPGRCKVIYNTDHPLIKEFYINEGVGDMTTDILDILFISWGQLLSKSGTIPAMEMRQRIATISEYSSINYERLARKYGMNNITNTAPDED